MRYYAPTLFRLARSRVLRRREGQQVCQRPLRLLLGVAPLHPHRQQYQHQQQQQAQEVQEQAMRALPLPLPLQWCPLTLSLCRS